MSKFCIKNKLKESGKVYAFEYDGPSSDQESEEDEETAQMVRTDEWEDSDEESEREENGEDDEHIYNINQNSAEDLEEDSEDEIYMVVAEHHHNYESESESDIDNENESTEESEDSEEEYEVEDWESEDEEDNMEGPTLEELGSVATESDDDDNVNETDNEVKLYRQKKEILISDEESDTAEIFMSDEDNDTNETLEKAYGHKSNNSDTDQQEETNTTEDQKWFMNITHEYTNWIETYEYGHLVLSTNDENWRMSKPNKPTFSQ